MDFIILNCFLLVLCAQINTIRSQSIDKPKTENDQLDQYENPNCNDWLRNVCLDCKVQHESGLNHLEFVVCENGLYSFNMREDEMIICCSFWSNNEYTLEKINLLDTPEECHFTKELLVDYCNQWSTSENNQIKLADYCAKYYRICETSNPPSPKSTRLLNQWTILAFVLLVLALIYYFVWL